MGEGMRGLFFSARAVQGGRPTTVHLGGVALDGNELSIEADELEARLFQHELDHLDGVLLVDHLDDAQRREARRALNEMAMARTGLSGSSLPPVPRSGGPDDRSPGGGLRLP